MYRKRLLVTAFKLFSHFHSRFSFLRKAGVRRARCDLPLQDLASWGRVIRMLETLENITLTSRCGKEAADSPQGRGINRRHIREV